MAEAFRKNEKIRGITVKAKNIKLSQYADDTTLILDGSIESLEESLRRLDLFGEVSGLRLNCGKTEALWIGAKVNSDLKLCPENNFKWPKGKVKALGFWFSSDSNITVSHNYIDKVEKVKAILSCWKFRRLSLLGKITVIKSLAVSQLVYILAPLQTDHKAIKEINVLFYKFLWDGKGDKIKRNVMINDFSEGGLKMIDIESFNKSLKSSWIKKYLDPENSSSWKSFFDLELQSHGGKTLFLGILTRKDACCFIEVSDPFIKEILEIWCEASFTENLTSEAQFLSSPLWYNSHIKIGNRPVFFKDWSLKGITEVKHVLNDSFEFLSLTAFQDKYNLQVPPLSYYGIISATNSLRRQSERTNASYESFLSKFLKNSKPSRLIYKKLVSIKSELPTLSQEKWHKEINLEPGHKVNWKAAYVLTFTCTKSSKLIVFNFKFLHRRLSTNSFLKKIGRIDNEKCTFCQYGKESLFHLFWECSKSRCFWNHVFSWMQACKIVSKEYAFQVDTCLGLRPDTSKYNLQINFCFLTSKHFIWLCKFKEQKPIFEEYLRHLQYIHKVEKEDTTTRKKWEPLLLQK